MRYSQVFLLLCVYLRRISSYAEFAADLLECPAYADFQGGADARELGGVSLLAVRADRELLGRHQTRPLTENDKTVGRVIPAAGCPFTFLDIGAHGGDTVDTFLHAEDRGQPRNLKGNNTWDPMDPKLADHDYGPWQELLRDIFRETKTKPSSYCVVGIEANKGWSSHYKRFQTHHANKAQTLGMHSGIALGLRDGTEDFQCQKPDPPSVWADGQPEDNPIVPSYYTQYPCVVKSRSLQSILSELHGQQAKVVIIRMDVELKINDVLPEFIQSGALESLTAKGVRLYMVVDTMHMNKKTLRLWHDLERNDMAVFVSLTVR